MAASKDEHHIQGIGQILVSENLLEKTKVLEFQQKAKEAGVSLPLYLEKNKILSAAAVAEAVSLSFGIPWIDLNSIELDPESQSLVNDKLIKEHHVIPLFTRGKNIYLATDDPSKQSFFKEIQFQCGLLPQAIIVESHKLQTLIDSMISSKENQGLDDYVQDAGELDGLEIGESEESDTEDRTSTTDDAPVVKFVNKILLDAIKNGVSDIHFEPYERDFRIRYRQDGILKEVANPPVALATRISARIKVMSHMDISERRIPQDGRFKMKLSKTRSIDFRVNSCPTMGGEKIVMRILDPGATKLGIEMLGFNAVQREHFMHAIHKPQGMILVTGPTGSGKTVTLYTALNLLNTDEVNISTAEDPVEIKLMGVNQVQINSKAGLHFSDTLRAFLRQDPDIIMVGEIRDLETAEIAIKAAQTGHMVLSTLHTNSAPETLTRLVNMGIPSFNIASSVNLIVAQRLARKLCDSCKQLRNDFTPQSLIELGFSEEDVQNMSFYKAIGCDQCNKGYRGRVGLYEVLHVSKAIGHIIMTQGNSLDISKQAKSEGMITIYQSGLEKIKQGITTIEEVNRVTTE